MNAYERIAYAKLITTPTVDNPLVPERDVEMAKVQALIAIAEILAGRS